MRFGTRLCVTLISVLVHGILAVPFAAILKVAASVFSLPMTYWQAFCLFYIFCFVSGALRLGSSPVYINHDLKTKGQ